jgi:hypothetical protein
MSSAPRPIWSEEPSAFGQREARLSTLLEPADGHAGALSFTDRADGGYMYWYLGAYLEVLQAGSTPEDMRLIEGTKMSTPIELPSLKMQQFITRILGSNTRDISTGDKRSEARSIMGLMIDGLENDPPLTDASKQDPTAKKA